MRKFKLCMLKMLLRLLLYVTVVVVGLFLSSCESEGDSDNVVLVGVTPPSVIIGEAITVELIALEPVFTSRKVTPVASAGNMVIRELSVVDGTHAIASIGTAQVDSPGIHSFELDFGDRIAAFEISAVSPPVGPGAVTCELTEATAGALNAEMIVLGSGTHFDSDVTAEVVGVPGMMLTSIDAVSESVLEINFNISLEQPPAQAIVRIIDGLFQYDVPVNIVPATILESTFTTQLLTKGQAGKIEIGAPNASFRTTLGYSKEYSDFEFGYPSIVEDNRISVPVRVDFNYPADTLNFDYYTYSNGGASLQIVQVAVALIDPGYVAVKPSVIPQDDSQYTVSVIGKNVDFTKIQSVTFASDDNVSLASWASVDVSRITMDLWVSSSGTEGYHSLIVNDGQHNLYGGLVLDTFGGVVYALHEAQENVAAGDHLYLNVTVLNIELDEDVSAEGDENIEVAGITRIDSGCVILELKINPDAPTGEYASQSTITLYDGPNEFPISIQTVSAGL